ncbi:hypothetical protein LLH23_22040 [bacterium]|nr:hypothetical protein [bacterium]
MNGKRLKEKLQAGERVFGFFVSAMTYPTMADAVPEGSVDFVVCTTEHTPLDLADFMPLQYVLRPKGVACLARVHSHDPWDIARICDTFDGVVVPYVEDVLQVRRMVAAAKGRTLKGEALEHFVQTGEFPSEATRAYVEQRNANTFFCPMIESPRSVENLDDICAIPGVDAVLVGPNDLTVSMGIPEERDHPDFIAIMQRIIDTAERHGVAAGCHLHKIEHSQRLIAQGARFIPYGGDQQFLAEGIRGFLKALKG